MPADLKIEAMLASPPDREELVVQLFAKDGGQWAEIFRGDGKYWIELYGSGSPAMRFDLGEMIRALERSLHDLRERLGD